MPLRGLLKKKDKVSESEAPAPEPRDVQVQQQEGPPSPVFTFLRSDTHTQEIISPPNFSSGEDSGPPSFVDGHTDGQTEKRTSRFYKGRARSSSAASGTSSTSRASESSKNKASSSKRLSERLHLRRSEASSSNVPTDLPEINVAEAEAEDGASAESQWEKRATMLAKQNEQERSRPSTPAGSTTDLGSFADLTLGQGRDKSPISTKLADDDIQEAIRLHEAGDLENSTRMFGRLADPKGDNNALSQVLYGLALRHGWGISPNPTEAVTYLSAAAANAASVEELALQAGMKKGGAAKGELVLAIFELANCFRHGWGVQVDKFAAKQYYETAANLGDTDAMNEVGWCYVEGFGCKKDKYAAAKYYRLAEKGGSKTLGNSWIWKEKYGDPKK